MRSLPFAPVLLVIAFAVSACGKEIGRIPLQGEGSGETQVQTTAGKKLALWTSLDVKHEGSLAARYEVELVESGGTQAVSAKVLCDPFDVNVKTSSKEISIGASRSVSYAGKMRCELVPKTTGPATIRARLSFAGKPASLNVKDMSLVVKE